MNFIRQGLFAIVLTFSFMLFATEENSKKTMVIFSGPPSSGKTSLIHALTPLLHQEGTQTLPPIYRTGEALVFFEPPTYFLQIGQRPDLLGEGPFQDLIDNSYRHFLDTMAKNQEHSLFINDRSLLDGIAYTAYFGQIENFLLNQGTRKTYEQFVQFLDSHPEFNVKVFYLPFWEEIFEPMGRIEGGLSSREAGRTKALILDKSLREIYQQLQDDFPQRVEIFQLPTNLTIEQRLQFIQQTFSSVDVL